MQPPWPSEAVVPAHDPGLSPGASGAPEVSVIRALKDVFADPEWKHNVLFALIFMIIPIVGPIALSGWMCEIQQRKARRHPSPVVYIEFADFGEYIKKGLTVFLVSLVSTLPLMVVLYGLLGAMAAFVFMTMSATGEALAGVAVGLVGGLVTALIMLCVGVVINALTTRAELTENFGEAFRMSELMPYIKATFWRVLVKNIVFGFVAFGIVLLGMLACYVGLYPAVAVIQIAAMHLRFQVYEEYLSRGGAPIPVKEAVALPSEQRAQY